MPSSARQSRGSSVITPQRMSRSNRRHVELFDLDAIGGEGVVDAPVTHRC